MIIGIDFGTTNSCISIFTKESLKIEIIPDNSGNLTYPTCLYFDKETSDILFGELAYHLLISKNNSMYIGNILHNIKRLVGVTWSDFQNNKSLKMFFNDCCINIIEKDIYCGIKLTYNNVNTEFSINNIIIFYLKYLKHLILNWLDDKKQQIEIVITVPAYFTDLQREIILSCCKKCDLNVIRIINEPTAAILSYVWQETQASQINNLECENYLVIDCGGGTTDLSLINVDYSEMVFQVETVEGDNFLGGQDLTNSLVNWVINILKNKYNQDIYYQHQNDNQNKNQNNNQNDNRNKSNHKLINIITKECEKVKNELSYRENAFIYLESINEQDYKIDISRAKFIDINFSFFDKIRKLLLKIRETNIPDKILFVGGTTNIPYFTELCKTIFGNKPIIINTLDKNTAVSIGATVQGIILKNLLETSDNIFKDTLLIDIVPMSIGVKTIGDIMAVVIPKNTSIPCEKVNIFTNSEDYSDSIDIDIYQGVRKFVKDNFYLGSLILENLDNTKKKGEMKIKVKFHVDCNGIIKITAEENLCGVSKEIIISKTYQTQKFDQVEEEFLKIDDMTRANKILAKLELYDSFKFLLARFHEIKKDFGKLDTWKQFQINEINILFNNIFEIIDEWEKYECEQIFQYKKLFEEEWHKIIYNLM